MEMTNRTNKEDALSHYTIEDLYGTDDLGNENLLYIIGRMENADRVDQEEYQELIKETIYKQPTL